MTGAKTLAFNPFGADFRRDPYPIYAKLRASEPVHRAPALGNNWVLTRREDVQSVLRDPRFSSNPLPKKLADLSERLRTQGRDIRCLATMSEMLFFFLDPPVHTRLRKLVGEAFSNQAVERLTPVIRATIDDLLDRADRERSFDIVRDFGSRLPVLVIARMLGVPTDQHDALCEWATSLSQMVDPLVSVEAYEAMNRVAERFATYFRALLAERRARPTDDLLTRLGAEGPGGDRLTEDEQVGIALLLFVSGEETTSNMIGNGMLALLQHPSARASLRAEPSLIDAAAEEVLRYDSPVQLTVRVANVDVSVAGRDVRKGERVFAALGAANRDPDHFADPERFDIERTPNRHLAFGSGVHFCLGATLARVQGKLALSALVERFPSMKLHPDPLAWRKNITLRGLTSLPVEIGHEASR